MVVKFLLHSLNGRTEALSSILLEAIGNILIRTGTQTVRVCMDWWLVDEPVYKLTPLPYNI